MIFNSIVFTRTDLDFKGGLTFTKVPGKKNVFTCDQLPHTGEIKGKDKGPFIAHFNQQRNRYELGLLTPPEAEDDSELILTPVNESTPEVPTETRRTTSVIPGPGGWSKEMNWLGCFK